MRMRQKVLRGQKLFTTTGEEVTALDVLKGDWVKVINPQGKIWSLMKSELQLAVIDTALYERL